MRAIPLLWALEKSSILLLQSWKMNNWIATSVRIFHSVHRNLIVINPWIDNNLSNFNVKISSILTFQRITTTKKWTNDKRY